MATRAVTTFRYATDAVVLALAVASVIEVFVLSVPGSKAVLAPAALLWSLPLLLRRRFPLAAPLAVFATVAAVSFAAGEAVPRSSLAFIALLLTFWALAVNNEHGRALAGGAAGAATIATVVANDPSGDGLSEFLWLMSFAALAWLAGAALYRRATHAAELHERAERIARERDAEARAAVAEERARIARELHDVVAHSVSVMTVQAAAVRRLLHPGQERERAALQTVEDTGRQALAEMRRLLGVLRRAEDDAALAPQPGMRNVETLVAQVRAAGLPVELRVEGAPVPLPPGIDLSAYRIVQEALTNALKHAGPARAEVEVRWRGDELELDVWNDGRSDGAGNGHGHGLAGMRERVAMCGGQLESGPRPGGGFRVHARLPVAEVGR